MIEVNEENFAEEVKGREGIVVVDFYAEWCGPCKMVAHVLEDLVSDVGWTDTNAEVVKVNVDASPELTAEHNVRGIPAIVFYKDGELLEDRITGSTQKQKILDIISNNL